MKKKKFILFPLLTLLLSSCLFDTDDEGLSDWLSDQGMPSNYKVQTVTVSGLKPVSVKAYKDTLPKNAYDRGILGAAEGISFDAVFDFAIDSSFLAKVANADSALSYLELRLADDFYRATDLPSEIHPIEEDLKIDVSWILSEKLTKKEYKKLPDISDSVWFDELESWKPQNSADTTVSVSLARKDSILLLKMPHDIVDDIRESTGNRRLQLRISAPEASHIYRFRGPKHSAYSPYFRLDACVEDSCKYYAYMPMRAAVFTINHEDCSDCLVLHDGTYDSLVVELPSKPIMKALSDFYGDEFPYSVGDSNDVRQAVVMAEVSFYRDDSNGENELGFPIQVLASTYIDSAELVICRSEDYLVDVARVLEKGHPNMVFYTGDSLTLQVTKGMRHFINKAADGRNFKMMLNLGSSVILDKDTLFYDRVNADNDTTHVFFPAIDYARYDFSALKDKAATLKLWLASKRGGK